MVLTLVFCLRRSEVLELHWKALDLEHKLLSVRYAV